MKTRLIILLFLFSLTTHLFSQNIDAKLGANGIFSIKIQVIKIFLLLELTIIN